MDTLTAASKETKSAHGPAPRGRRSPRRRHVVALISGSYSEEVRLETSLKTTTDHLLLDEGERVHGGGQLSGVRAGDGADGGQGSVDQQVGLGPGQLGFGDPQVDDAVE